MKRNLLFLSLIFLLSGCHNNHSIESKVKFQLEKSKYDGAEVTLHYTLTEDSAYPDTFLAIEPVILETKLSNKIIDFESNVRNLGGLEYIGTTGGIYKECVLEIKKESKPKRWLRLFENGTLFWDYDEEMNKCLDEDREPLYLTYSLSDKDNLDTSFLDEIKSIIDSSEIHSRKSKDC